MKERFYKRCNVVYIFSTQDNMISTPQLILQRYFVYFHDSIINVLPKDVDSDLCNSNSMN